jgi:hypothetical protein
MQGREDITALLPDRELGARPDPLLQADSQALCREWRRRSGVRVTTRRIWVSMSSSWRWKKAFEYSPGRAHGRSASTRRKSSGMTPRGAVSRALRASVAA